MYNEDLDFEIVAMKKRELAVLYSPELTPHAAVNRLMNWINLNPALLAALEATGYRKTLRLLSPVQVALIIKHLGEP